MSPKRYLIRNILPIIGTNNMTAVNTKTAKATEMIEPAVRISERMG